MEPIACVGALLRDDQRRLLLVLRTQAPAAGTWSLPGGRVEPGETRREACVREVREETGLIVEVVRHVGRVEVSEIDATERFVVDDYVCRIVGGSARAGDDAGDLRWVEDEDLTGLSLSPGLRSTLQSWGEVP